MNAASPIKNEELSLALDQWPSVNPDRVRVGATELDSVYEELDADNDKSVVRGQSSPKRNLYRTESFPGSEKSFQPELENALKEAGVDPGSVLEISRLVTSKIKFAPASGPGSNESQARSSSETISQITSLRDENTRLQSKIREMENSPRADLVATRALSERCEVLVKERGAVHTIMEQKINILVQSISQAVSSVLQSNPQSASSPSGVALRKDIDALQRLVNASIAALRNAAGFSGAPVTPVRSAVVGTPMSSANRNIPSRQPPPPPLYASSNGVL